MKFSKKDFLFSVVTGLTTGVILWQIAGYTHRVEIYGFSYAWFVLIIPILWILGVNLGYLLGRFFEFFNQFGKFASIGFTNWAVDVGILAILLSVFNVTAGVFYTVFKSISFIVASIHSFVWNKFWVFQAGGGNTGVQFGKFFGVSVISLVINVLVASIVVNFIKPAYGFNPETWAVVGSVAGSAVALIFSFIGFKLAVFNKKDNADSVSQIQT